LERSRLEAFVRLGQGAGEQASLALRCERMQATREANGALRARWDGVVADLLGAVTARVPSLEATRMGGALALSARDLKLVVPGAGTLVAADHFEARVANDEARVVVKPPTIAGNPPTPAGAMEATFDLGWADGFKPRGDLFLRTIPATALAPLLRRAGISVAAGTANFELHVRPAAGPEAGVAGSFAGAVSGLDVHHPRLDRVPWRDVSLSLEGTGAYSPRDRRLELKEGAITALGLSAALAGWLTLNPAFAGELRVSPPPKTAKACAEAFATWPAPLRTRLAGLIVSGRLGVTGRLRFDERNWDDLGLSLNLAPLCQVVAEPNAITDLRQGRTPRVAEMVQIKDLPAHVVGAFLTAEDGGFRRHDGFDIEMIRRALAHDMAMGTLSKGASTLSQQVAKNLFLGPERTIARKLAELVLTWRLEEAVGKDRILELYLNIVELGPNLRGLGAAATRYFGKPASALSPLEAAHLASLLPNPLGFARRFREGRIDDGWLHKLYDLLGRMQRSGYLSTAALQAARAETLALRRQ
ncbi:MAG TPA: biosynthetic peptidoglycan transglycosylase, partial [Polyangia bacterium]